jgi:hypothetical protein
MEQWTYVGANDFDLHGAHSCQRLPLGTAYLVVDVVGVFLQGSVDLAAGHVRTGEVLGWKHVKLVGT